MYKKHHSKHTVLVEVGTCTKMEKKYYTINKSPDIKLIKHEVTLFITFWVINDEHADTILPLYQSIYFKPEIDLHPFQKQRLVKGSIQLVCSFLFTCTGLVLITSERSFSNSDTGLGSPFSVMFILIPLYCNAPGLGDYM